MKKFYICRCFYSRNIFLKQYNLHVTYENDVQFLSDFGKILRSKGCDNEEKVKAAVNQIKEEINRRQNLDRESFNRRDIISTRYSPLHKDVYNLKEEFVHPELVELSRYCRSAGRSVDGVKERVQAWGEERMYMFPVFTKSFCDKLMEELEHFEDSDCPKGRPNTMNKYGILLNELGFDEGLISPLLYTYLSPITAILFPDWGGDSLDSYKAFVVKYKIGDDLDLAYHYDNAELTLNVALGKDFSEGGLYFGDMRTEQTTNTKYIQYDHQPQFGLLHRGQHLHGAMPIDEGERYNLIIWMRSSRIRNKKCPMCDEKPELVEALGSGDGFTKEEMVNVCTSF